MSAQHTPGPWKVCSASEGRCKCGQVWSEPGDMPVAIVTIGKWGDDFASLRFIENDSAGTIGARVEAYNDQITYGEVDHELGIANARLIAAAPELLQELRHIIGDDLSQHTASARATIARAEGRQP